MDIKNESTMLERGKFVANGYTFTVRPVYLGEEDDFLSQVTISPVPVNPESNTVEETKNDKQLGKYAIALFSEALNNVKKKTHGRIYEFFFWLFNRRDYRYYKDVPLMQPLIMWIEKKVTYNGKRVYFYDLERKYGLSKAEIERLFIYFYELSGF